MAAGAAVSPSVVAVGSPMWDTMACVGEDFLREHGLRAGDATLVAEAEAFRRLKAEAAAASSRPPLTGCGGCASNTAKVLARLGCRAALCGGIGRDEVAGAFRKRLESCGLQDLTQEAGEDCPDTGEVLCLVTPAGERTFAYRPGASSSLTPEGLSRALEAHTASTGSPAFVYFDVYTFLCPGELAEEGMRMARRLGAKVGLNLGSPGIVAERGQRLWALLREGLVDALFMNEDEAQALGGAAGVLPKRNAEGEALSKGGTEGEADASGAEAAEAVAEAVCASTSAYCSLAVVTLGERGLWAAVGGPGARPERHRVAAATVVDSTGAGDFFAGGFLAAWLRGLPVEACAAWGAAAAARVLGVLGADLAEKDWDGLRAGCLGEA